MTLAERAVQIWQVLVGAAYTRQTLTYRLLGDRIGVGANLLASPLGLVARYCDVKMLPPLTVLVVRQGDGRPGEGFTWATDLDGAREAVYDCAWYQLRPPGASDFALIEQMGIGEHGA